MEYTVNHYPEKHRFEVVEDGLDSLCGISFKRRCLGHYPYHCPKKLGRAWDCGDSC